MLARKADSEQYPYLECPKDGKEFRRWLSAAEVKDVARGDNHVGVATASNISTINQGPWRRDDTDFPVRFRIP